MDHYLIGPHGIRVEPVRLRGADLIFARMVDPDAQPGEEWFRVTQRGAALGPGYVRDVEALAELVPLAELRAPEEAGEETA
ncbi:hypothetical protein ACU635_50505 [[Actinomadura] parvosata]|uniref:hypothetical protein n=1 Tax=[Actinomadura] parvosata TaxID=1955412 RepID=UPI00406C864C